MEPIGNLDERSYRRKRLREIISILRKNKAFGGMTPAKLKKIMEDLGPTFIKFGQILSMRPDILPEKYCTELMKLRAEVTALPFREIIEVVKEEYPIPWQEVFGEITEKPVGSASIAQVHTAKLKDGREVVVKIQRPGIYAIMYNDIRLMNRIMGFVNRFGGLSDTVDLKMVVGEIWSAAKQEMNFLLEADHLAEFAMENQDIAYVTAPKVHMDISTSRVLVMEDVTGIRIDEVDKLREAGYDLHEIGTKLAENYVKQVIDDGFFHADPHPANIYIRDGKIVWLDLGMVGRLSNRDRSLFKKAALAIAEDDVGALKEALLVLGRPEGKVNHSKLSEDIDNTLTKYASLPLSEMDMVKIFEELMALAKTHGIKLPPGVSMLGRGIVTLEGVLVQISPDINFLSILANHMSGKALDDLDLRSELMHLAKSLYSSGKKSASIPSQLSDILKMTARGQTRLNVEYSVGEDTRRYLSRLVSRLVAGVILAALLLGSSLLAGMDIAPRFMGMPLIAFLGYMCAFLLAVWMLIRAIRKK